MPGLVIFLGLDQHQAEATSLLAIIPVAIVGTIRQDRYGNVRRADALTLGVLSLAGAAGGVALANALSGTRAARRVRRVHAGGGRAARAAGCCARGPTRGGAAEPESELSGGGLPERRGGSSRLKRSEWDWTIQFTSPSSS